MNTVNTNKIKFKSKIIKTHKNDIIKIRHKLVNLTIWDILCVSILK